MENNWKKDEFGEIFQDDLTENTSKAPGPIREDEEEKLTLDPGIDSQEDDEMMAENRFGVNQPKKSEG